MKTCRKCGLEKPIDDFYAMVGMRDGYRNECKRCNLDAKACRYRANPEPARARAKQWRLEHPERYAKRQAAYRASGRRALNDRRSYLRRKYNVTPEWYDAKLAAQGGGCAICGRPPRSDISLHVDHDHATGRVRRLLCFPCNNLLGDANDDPARLRAAAAYLDEHDPVIAEMRQLVKRRVRMLVG